MDNTLSVFERKYAQMMISSNDNYAGRAISVKMTAVYTAIVNFNNYCNYEGFNRRGRTMKTLPRNDRIMK